MINSLSMDAMTDTKAKTKRRPPIAYRVPVDLEDEFDQRVKRSGLSTNAFLTQSWLGKPLLRQVRRPPIEKKLLAKMLYQLTQLADGVRALLLNPECENTNVLLEEIRDELKMIRIMIFKLMGRKP